MLTADYKNLLVGKLLQRSYASKKTNAFAERNYVISDVAIGKFSPAGKSDLYDYAKITLYDIDGNKEDCIYIFGEETLSLLDGNILEIENFTFKILR